MSNELNISDIAEKVITNALVQEIANRPYFITQIANALVGVDGDLINRVAKSIDTKKVVEETAKIVLQSLGKKDTWNKREYYTEAVVTETKKELARLLAQREYDRIVASEQSPEEE